MPNPETATDWVCVRFIMFPDRTAETRIVEYGTEVQCRRTADDPSPDLEADPYKIISQHFRAMPLERFEKLVAEGKRQNGRL